MTRVLLLFTTLNVLLSCTGNSKGIFPTATEISFPIAVVADPRGDYIYVVNSNFDLKRNGGTIVAIDVVSHQVVASASIRIGSFGGNLTLLTQLVDGKLAATRGFVPVRDSRSLYWFNIGRNDQNLPTLGCTVQNDKNKSDPVPGCNDKYVIHTSKELEKLGQTPPVAFETLGTDPYSGTIGEFEGDNYYFMGTLRGTDCLATNKSDCSKVSVFRLGDESTTLVAQRDHVMGVQAMAVHPKSQELYVTSRFFDTIQVMKLQRNAENAIELANSSTFSVGNVGNTGDFARALSFNQSGTRAYIVHRNPASLAVVDTSIDSDGSAKNRVLNVIELGSDPSDIQLVHNATLNREFAYVVCFRSNEIYVVDTELMMVVDVLRLRKGPYNMAVINNPTLGIKRAYITNFEHSSISVLELDENSPYYHQEIAAID